MKLQIEKIELEITAQEQKQVIDGLLEAEMNAESAAAGAEASRNGLLATLVPLAVQLFSGTSDEAPYAGPVATDPSAPGDTDGNE